MQEMWNERFASSEYVYGELPNTFLVENLGKLAHCRKILLLAEGEGRNAVFLAREGFSVTAVDFSEVGREKCMALAQKYAVTVDYRVADLANYVFPSDCFDAVIAIFAHTPSAIRQSIHAKMPNTLKQHGICLIKGYTPEQISLGTGGPKDPDMMISSRILTNEIVGLDVLHCKEKRVNLKEGKLHNGESAIVEYIARKL